MARHSALWQSQRPGVVREKAQEADQLARIAEAA
jgi:hypothetical protein